MLSSLTLCTSVWANENDQPNPKYDGFSAMFLSRKPTEKNGRRVQCLLIMFWIRTRFFSHHQVAVTVLTNWNLYKPLKMPQSLGGARSIQITRNGKLTKKNGKSTICRCISYWKRWIPTVILVYLRVCRLPSCLFLPATHYFSIDQQDLMSTTSLPVTRT